jgi:hypothetical protein
LLQHTQNKHDHTQTTHTLTCTCTCTHTLERVREHKQRYDIVSLSSRDLPHVGTHSTHTHNNNDGTMGPPSHTHSLTHPLLPSQPTQRSLSNGSTSSSTSPSTPTKSSIRRSYSVGASASPRSSTPRSPGVSTVRECPLACSPTSVSHHALTLDTSICCRPARTRLWAK